VSCLLAPGCTASYLHRLAVRQPRKKRRPVRNSSAPSSSSSSVFGGGGGGGRRTTKGRNPPPPRLLAGAAEPPGRACVRTRFAFALLFGRRGRAATPPRRPGRRPRQSKKAKKQRQARCVAKPFCSVIVASYYAAVRTKLTVLLFSAVVVLLSTSMVWVAWVSSVVVYAVSGYRVSDLFDCEDKGSSTFGSLVRPFFRCCLCGSLSRERAASPPQPAS